MCWEIFCLSAFVIQMQEIFMPNVAIGWKFWILWVLVCVGGGFGCFIVSVLALNNQNGLGAID